MSRIDLARHRAAMTWLAAGDSGLSSETIVYAALNLRYSKWGDNYPHDAGDLGRCLRMLERMPWAAAGIKRLARRNKAWRALAKHWSELKALYDAEKYLQVFDRIQSLVHP